MATILFTWELGANLGHLVPISRIAAELGPDGHRHVFAVGDLKHAAAILGNDAAILQAPVWPEHRHFGATGGVASYADILSAVGFGDPSKLVAMIRAWTALIDLVRPDVVVADHSPGLQLALHGRDIPVVAIGSCFTMPPLDNDRFPLIRGDRAPLMPEGRLLESVRKVQSELRAKIPSNLPSLFRTEGRAVFGHPELDPYRPYRREPIAAPPGGLPRPRPWPRERRLFAYVGGEIEHFESLMQAIASLEIPLEAFLRGEVGPVPAFLRMRGATIHDQPQPLTEMLARASHVITQGGAMTSAAIFTAGRPHLVIPGHDEAKLNLEMLSRFGVAKRLEMAPDPRQMADSIGAFLDDIDLVDNALKQANRVAALQLPDGAELAAGLIRTQIG